MQRLTIAGFAAAFLAASPVVTAEPLTDHALISAYEGSTMRRKKVIEFDEYTAFTGMDESGKAPTGLTLEGRITTMLYDRPKERSILEVFRNYELALSNAGAEVLYRCDQAKGECAKRYAGPTLQKYSGIMSVSNLAGRYALRGSITLEARRMSP